jgi:hypothetical protein
LEHSMLDIVKLDVIWDIFLNKFTHYIQCMCSSVGIIVGITVGLSTGLPTLHAIFHSYSIYSMYLKPC